MWTDEVSKLAPADPLILRISKLYSEYKVLEPGTPDSTVPRKKALGLISRKPKKVRGQRPLVEYRDDDGNRSVYRAGGELASAKEVKEFSIGNRVSKVYYDEYGNPRQGMTGGQKVALGGAGITALGAKQLVDAKKVPAIAHSRLNYARVVHAENTGLQHRAQKEFDFQTGRRQTAPVGAKWTHKGRLRRSERKLMDAQKAADKSRQVLTNNVAAVKPEVLAQRAKHMKRAGKGLVVAGIATATSPLWADRFKKSDEVSKTISQARYGGNMEMGRAWRGEEKKDRRAAGVAVGGAGVAAGGLGAVAIGSNRLARPRPRGVESYRAQAAAARGFAEQENKAAARAQRRIRATEKKATVRVTDPAGKISTAISDDPGIQRVLRGHKAAKLEATHTRAIWGGEAGRADSAARRAPALIASDNAGRVGARRLVRGGRAVAALGAATAIGAGIKAERDRGGFGRHKRPRP